MNTTGTITLADTAGDTAPARGAWTARLHDTGASMEIDPAAVEAAVLAYCEGVGMSADETTEALEALEVEGGWIPEDGYRVLLVDEYGPGLWLDSEPKVDVQGIERVKELDLEQYDRRHNRTGCIKLYSARGHDSVELDGSKYDFDAVWESWLLLNGGILPGSDTTDVDDGSRALRAWMDSGETMCRIGSVTLLAIAADTTYRESSMLDELARATVR